MHSIRCEPDERPYAQAHRADGSPCSHTLPVPHVRSPRFLVQLVDSARRCGCGSSNSPTTSTDHRTFPCRIGTMSS